MSKLYVVNWEKYQHYKDRTPPWIKLHAEILNDYDFSCLQDASKLHLVLIWVLASQLNNEIPDDPEWVKKRIGATEEVDLKSLIAKGFLSRYQDASTALAKCSPETEAEAERYLLTLRVRSLGEIENHKLDGHYQGWFEENCPLVCRYELRDELVRYCRSKGKSYKDYWATLQTWGTRKQKELSNENAGRKLTKSEQNELAKRKALAELGVA